MLNTQLHTLLQIIDKKEMVAFGYYLKGIYPGRKRIHILHDYLIKSFPVYDVPRMSRNRVKSKVFDKPVNDGALLNLYGEMSKFLEAYLVIVEMDNEPFIKDYLLTRFYERKKIKSLFFKQIENAQKNIEQQIIKSGLGVFYFLKTQILHHLKYFHSNDASSIMNIENNEVKLAKIELNHYYEIISACYEVEDINRENLFLTKHILESQHSEKYDLLSQLYHLKHNVVANSNALNYEELKIYFFKNYKLLNNQEQSSTLTYLCNAAMNIIKQGDLDFIMELFLLYKFSFEKDILFIDDFISSSKFHNIITIASDLGKFEWLEKFLLRYENDIKNDSKDNIKKLGDAQILFKQNKYKDTIELLDGIVYENSYFELRAKTLVLRSLYSCNEDVSTILNYHRAFGAVLTRSKKLTTRLKEGYKNFLKHFEDMYTEKYEPIILAERINQDRYLQCRKWLLSILENNNSK